jgi:hypothetical protein
MSSNHKASLIQKEGQMISNSNRSSVCSRSRMDTVDETFRMHPITRHRYLGM